MTIEYVANHFADLAQDRPSRFDEMAGAVFAFQRQANPAYNRYCNEVHHANGSTSTIHPSTTPFLPVDGFKLAPITTFDPADAEVIFRSSATGRSGRSRHYVRDLSIYETAVTRGFELAHDDEPWRIVAHLPEYAPDSSLVYMLRHLIGTFGAEGSGVIGGDADRLAAAADTSRRDGMRLMLFGAAFGLLDLLDAHEVKMPAGAVVVETGGMKTHRRHITRTELHARLAEGFSIQRDRIRSEYGMCELMSQCYTRGGEAYTEPPWMRCFVVDPLDPRRELPDGETGILAVVDLANLYSCSFLLTADRAVRRADGFEILGRAGGAELRGCNFLLENA